MKGLVKYITYLLFLFGFIVMFVLFPSMDNFMDKLALERNIKNKVVIDDSVIVSKSNDVDTIKSKYLYEDYDFDTNYYPYYGILDDRYKPLYRQIYVNAINTNSTFKPCIDIYKEELGIVVEAVLYDHPELFFLDNNYSYKYNNSGKCTQIILKYNSTINNLEYNKALFDEVTNEIINEANKYNTDYEKELYVHDKLVSMLHYDSRASMNQTAYSALVNHNSVCAGYAHAFQYILIKLGIPCFYVTGDSTGDHAWNIVYIDGNYYNVDVTWDNTLNSRYAYFNKSDIEFSDTHTRGNLSSYLPTCDDISSNTAYIRVYMQNYAN